MDKDQLQRLRLRPNSVCPRCDAHMERKTTIAEKAGYRHWGDVDPFLKLAGLDIHHFICISCGNVSAYQVKFEFEGFGGTRESRRARRQQMMKKP